MLFLFTYSTTWSMTGKYLGRIRQREELLTDALQQLFAITSCQVCSTYAQTKESIATEQNILFLTIKTDSALSMTGCFDHFQLMLTKTNHVTFFQEPLNRSRRKFKTTVEEEPISS